MSEFRNGDGGGHANGHTNGYGHGRNGVAKPRIDPMAVPPQNLQAEQALLSAMICDPSSIDEVMTFLNPMDFWRSTNQLLCRILFRRRSENLEIDMLTVKDELEQEHGYTPEQAHELIMAAIDSAGYVYAVQAVTYAHIVRDKARLRALREACNAIMCEIYAQELSADDVVSHAEARVLEIAAAGMIKQPQTLAQILPRAMARIHERRSGRFFGMSTGLSELDEQLDGGLPNGSLTIFAGRVGMGKSSLAFGVCERASLDRGLPTLFISLEMGELDLADRLLAGRSGIDGKFIRRSQHLEPREFIELDALASALRPYPLAILDLTRLDMDQISAIVRCDVASRDTRLVVIDYLGLISGPGKLSEGQARPDSRQVEVARMAGRCKDLSRKHDIPVVLACQLNREFAKRKDKRPNISDLRESGAIEQDADIVVLVHRPEYYKPGDEPGIAELNVAKWRNGRTGQVRVTWRGAQTRFENMSNQEVAF